MKVDAGTNVQSGTEIRAACCGCVFEGLETTDPIDPSAWQLTKRTQTATS